MNIPTGSNQPDLHVPNILNITDHLGEIDILSGNGIMYSQRIQIGLQSIACRTDGNGCIQAQLANNLYIPLCIVISIQNRSRLCLQSSTTLLGVDGVDQQISRWRGQENILPCPCCDGSSVSQLHQQRCRICSDSAGSRFQNNTGTGDIYRTVVAVVQDAAAGLDANVISGNNRFNIDILLCPQIDVITGINTDAAGCFDIDILMHGDAQGCHCLGVIKRINGNTIGIEELHVVPLRCCHQHFLCLAQTAEAESQIDIKWNKACSHPIGNVENHVISNNVGLFDTDLRIGLGAETSGIDRVFQFRCRPGMTGHQLIIFRVADDFINLITIGFIVAVTINAIPGLIQSVVFVGTFGFQRCDCRLAPAEGYAVIGALRSGDGYLVAGIINRRIGLLVAIIPVALVFTGFQTFVSGDIVQCRRLGCVAGQRHIIPERRQQTYGPCIFRASVVGIEKPAVSDTQLNIPLQRNQAFQIQVACGLLQIDISGSLTAQLAGGSSCGVNPHCASCGTYRSVTSIQLNTVATEQ